MTEPNKKWFGLFYIYILTSRFLSILIELLSYQNDSGEQPSIELKLRHKGIKNEKKHK
jgi:hypothetical protein